MKGYNMETNKLNFSLTERLQQPPVVINKKCTCCGTDIKTTNTNYKYDSNDNIWYNCDCGSTGLKKRSDNEQSK